MFDLPGPLGTFANFLVIALGFGLIVFIHELGHFLAAKWAGIRVLAFSIGFGQVACSYRKGIGFRMGSSEPEYLKQAYGLSNEQTAELHERISPTEYRLSWLPLGGYVKMLGQEDLNPDAVSDEPDSYQNCSVFKRMVVICAGVLMNVISAAILFVIVFNAGLKVFPAELGYIAPDGPGAIATPVDRDDVGIGLQRGDLVTEINGKKMYSFEHILPEIAMSRKGQPVSIIVEREGVEGPIEFHAQPEKNPMTGLLGIQVSTPISTQTMIAENDEEQGQLRMFARNAGVRGMESGDRLVRVADAPARSPYDLIDAAEESKGTPFDAIFEREGDGEVTISVTPVRELQTGVIPNGEDFSRIDHILGLHGVMMVDPNASIEETKQGLMPGDIFARIGDLEFPSELKGREYVGQNAGKPLEIEVLRGNPESGYERVSLDVEVTRDGRIGFYPVMSTAHAPIVHQPIRIAEYDAVRYATDKEYEPSPIERPADQIIDYAGSRIISVAGTEITNLREIVGIIVDATGDAFESDAETFSIPITIELPLPVQPDGSIPTTTKSWGLTRADIEQLRELGWTLPGGNAIAQVFQPYQVIDRSPSPAAAIERGIAESRRVMMQTYLTFLRLFQGSVEVRHLKGPVGIAHLGTQIASQGFIWVLFFMALISINLAVINFLPIPIVDGGQFLMLCYEWIRGRPVPIAVQNVATLAGLLFIGMMFLYVTFNDIKNIFGA